MFRRFLVYCILFIYTTNIFAFEGDIFYEVHTLDELPSIQTERELLIEASPITSYSLETPDIQDVELDSLIAARTAFIHEDATSLITPLSPPRIFDIMRIEEAPFVIINPESILSSFLEEVDSQIIGQQGQKIRTEKKTRFRGKSNKFEGTIEAELGKDTLITVSDGSIISSETIGISEVSDDIIRKGENFHAKGKKKHGSVRKGQGTPSPRVFEFGNTKKHLIFSHPVKITLDMPGMTDGGEVEIGVMHSGDTEFGVFGLTTSPLATCLSDGSASIPGNLTSVIGGKVTFYTCGASRFTMNPTGGYTGSNDLRLLIGDCGQFQLYYNSGANMYTGLPPATGCNNTLDSWIALRIGGTTYGSDWTAWTTNTMTGSTNGNTYTGRTTLVRSVTGRNYTLTLDWRYIAPNKFFNIDWSVNIPAGNTNNVRFYLANDSTVGGADTNDVGYTGSSPSRTVGVFDNVLDQISAIRYLSGIMWTAEQADGYNNVRTQITNGADFTNAIQTTAGDLGFGVNWNLGTTPGTYTGALEWRMLPYTTGSTVDLIPGIGQPEGPLTVNFQSQIPVTITNAGNITSSGVHTGMLYIPSNITGPTSSFTDNGWSCGAQVGTGVTCTKTTTIASLGSDTFRVPVTPPLAASGANVTFTGTISNANDANITNNSAYAINAVVSLTSNYNPGGVASPTIWYRANNGTNCTTSGCTITTWNNSGSLSTAANATTGSGTAIYSSGALINNNPTIYLQNASLNMNSTAGITTTYSIFTVTKIGNGGKFPIATQTGVTNALEWVTTPTYDTTKLWAGATSFSGTNGRSVLMPAITSTIRSSTGLTQGRTNGFQYLTGTLATAITASRLRIGGSATTSGSLAHVAEVIIYNTTLTGTNLNKVESYLATKYGLPLSQNTITNYTLSNGTIGMNGTVMTGYLNNIAGIARDDTSTLNQLRSQSATNTGDIIVSKSSISTDRGALYWGNNGASINSLTTTDIATGSVRINREWRFEENTSDLGTITVSYLTGALPGGFSGTLMMFIDSDGIFASGATYITGSYNTGSASWDFSVNIADGEYITFGKSPPSDTTSPFMTSANVSSGSLLPIGTMTFIYGYSDTGSLINTGSLTGSIYSWNTGSSTWNATNLATTYMSITGTTSNTTGSFIITHLPSGKYRFDIEVADTSGNTLIQSFTYFIDGVNWSIDSAIYNIGDIIGNTSKFGTGELIITIQTVGAGFTLSTSPYQSFLSTNSGVINYWDGSFGWGYDVWNGFAYSGSISSHNPSALLATQGSNINQNGEKNTYTYRIKYGALVGSEQNAGDYEALVSFHLNLTY